MSDELKTNNEAIFAWWDDEYDVGCYNKHGDKRYTPDSARKYVPADLLPVVKPLVWEDFQDRGSKSYVFGRACYLITRWSDGQFELCESYPGYQGARIGKGFFDTMKAAKAAAQADHDARIRACLDMTDPAALVAGAYEAAAMEFDGWDNVPVQMTYDESRDRIRALTPADAQRALDAAIRKAVNEKLEEVAAKVAPMTIKIAGTPYQAGCGQIADTILAMKEDR